MLYYTDLENKILEKTKTQDFNNLTIISGYLGIEPIKRLRDFPNIHAVIIYGMYGSDNISSPLHKALVELQESAPNIEILYSTVPVHSKIYLWKEDDTP